jgi:ParB-like chromosome segregation protein Spo0J
MSNPSVHRLPVESVEPDYASLSDHPFAYLMPMMSEEERARQLAADIKRNGLQVRIDLFEGMILDGRNRYRALKSLGITPAEEHFKIFSGTKAEAEAYVISTNLHRRQLNNKQKQEFAQAMIAKYPDKSDFALGHLTSLSKNTIAAAREAMKNSPEKRRADAFAKAWNALSEEQQVSFVLAHRADIRDMLDGGSVNLTQPITPQSPEVAGGSS